MYSIFYQSYPDNMSVVDRFIFRFKHECSGKPKAIVIPRPCVGTTNYLRYLKWKQENPNAKFYEHNGMYFMVNNN